MLQYYSLSSILRSLKIYIISAEIQLGKQLIFKWDRNRCCLSYALYLHSKTWVLLLQLFSRFPSSSFHPNEIFYKAHRYNQVKPDIVAAWGLEANLLCLLWTPEMVLWSLAWAICKTAIQQENTVRRRHGKNRRVAHQELMPLSLIRQS